MATEPHNQNSLSHLLLSLPHGKKLQLVATKTRPLRKLHQITGRIRARTQDKDDWRVRVGLLEYRLKTDHGRGHVLLAHASCHEVCDGEVHPVDAEAAKKQEALEICQAFLVLAGERGGFWRVVVIPLKRNEF